MPELDNNQTKQQVKAILSPTLSKGNKPRYVIVERDTGELLDDAQGYGYRTKQKAHAAWAYKTRDKSKDAEREAKRKHIQAWLRTHKGFAKAMAQYAFEIECKKSWGPEDKFDAKFVKQMLEDYQLNPDFSAAELLRVWRKS